MKTYRFLKYKIESYRFGLKKVFKSENSILEELYEGYIEKVLKGEIFPESSSGYNSEISKGNENIFLILREIRKGSLTDKDEIFLISILKSNIGKWFVPHALSVTDHFSIRLMHELLETGITVYDPSYNYCFIKAAKRVYNFKVQDYLIKRYKKSNLVEKKGVLRALYWTEAKYAWRKETGVVEMEYELNYKWTDLGRFSGFELDYRISELDKEKYKTEMERRAEEKIEILLDDYLTTNNQKLKNYLYYVLPRIINDLPDRLKNKRRLYLNQL